MAAWPDWSRIDAAVKKGECGAETDQFKLLQQKVTKSSPEEISEGSEWAKLAWAFLVRFGMQKKAHRNLVKEVVLKLASVPSWCAAYSAQPELHEQVKELHPDLQAAFGTCTAEASAPGTPPRVSNAPQFPRSSDGVTSASGEDWEEWPAIELIVQQGRAAGATDEFAQLRARISKASVQELQRQASHAEVMWKFLFAFAVERNAHRSHVKSVIERLKESQEWMAVFNNSSQLKDMAQLLHQDLRDLFSPPVPDGSSCTPSPQPDPLEDRVAKMLASAAASTPPDKQPDSGAIDQVTSSPPPVQQVTANGTDGQLLAELKAMTLSALKKRALELGVGRDKFDEADGQDDPKQAVIELILAKKDAPVAPVAAAATQPPPTHMAVHASQDVGSAASASATAPLASATSLESILATCKSFLAQSEVFDSTRPVVGYYIRRHVVETLVHAYKENKKTPESEALMLSNLDRAEKDMKILDLTHGQAEMEAFAQQIFEQAHKLEKPASDAHFYLAGILFRSVAQFYDGEIPAAFSERASVATLRGSSYQGGPVVIEAPKPVSPMPQPTMSPAMPPGYPTPSPPAGAPSSQDATAPAGQLARAATAPGVQPECEPSPASTMLTRAATAPPQATSGQKKKQAKEKTDLAMRRLDDGRVAEAKQLITEALQLLEG